MSIETIEPQKSRKRVELHMVNGFELIEGARYAPEISDAEYQEFFQFYDAQVKQDPYSKVRDRAMIKLIYDAVRNEFQVNSNQHYFQTYGANDSDGGKVRVFPPVDPVVLSNAAFCKVLALDKTYLNDYATRCGAERLNISVHFIRYKAQEGEASYSSPVWLHLDDEPLVFIHLIRLTPNALGADSVISGMDNFPTHVYRLQNPFDTLIVDRAKKHAVTPLGSVGGMAYRDVMLVNLEAEVQQQ